MHGQFGTKVLQDNLQYPPFYLHMVAMVDLDLLFIGACGVRDSDASAEHQDVLTRGRLRRQSRCPSANHTRRQTNKTTHLLLLLSLTVISLYSRRRVPMLTKVVGGGESTSAQTDTNEIAYAYKQTRSSAIAE